MRAPDGRELSRTFRTRKEADRFEREERSSIHRGTWIDPDDRDVALARALAGLATAAEITPFVNDSRDIRGMKPLEGKVSVARSRPSCDAEAGPD